MEFNKGPETDPNIYEHLVYDKHASSEQSERTLLLKNGARKTGYHDKEEESIPYFISDIII